MKNLIKKIEQHLQNDIGKKWKCTICEKTLADKSAAKFHVEIHFDGLSFPCQDEYCGKIFRSRKALKIHRLNTQHKTQHYLF